MDQYTGVLCDQLALWSDTLRTTADTLYFGGGTPSLMGGRRLSKIIETARRGFLLPDAEITVEVNPGTPKLESVLSLLSDAGVNRLSVGLQSADETELSLLGRRHTPLDVIHTLNLARQVGIENLSLDLMLGIPHQTRETLLRSISFCAQADVSHVSAYLLKIEEDTPFYAQKAQLPLPDEDEEKELYLFACAELEARGFMQYEISNFARSGRESAHNLHYWNAEPYLGLGPSAHAFVQGRRFYFPRDLAGFLRRPETVDDGEGGGMEEYAMLRLRLKDGLAESAFSARFGCAIPTIYRERMSTPELEALCCVDARGIRLTREGFLLSNLLIGRMLND